MNKELAKQLVPIIVEKNQEIKELEKREAKIKRGSPTLDEYDSLKQINADISTKRQEEQDLCKKLKDSGFPVDQKITVPIEVKSEKKSWLQGQRTYRIVYTIEIFGVSGGYTAITSWEYK